MKKTFLSLLGAGLALLLVMQACNPDPIPEVPPLPDGGAWVECSEADAGACAPSEQCRYVDVYERYLCLRLCDVSAPCGDLGVECCGGNEDGGAGGYCQPKDQCEWLKTDAGTGSDGGTGNDGGTDSGDAGTDAGSGAADGGVDAGTQPTVDAGTQPPADADAGTQPTVDAGTQPTVDAGTQPTVDAGTQPTMDAGTQPTVDAGTQPTVDAGSPIDAGTEPTVDAGTGVDAGSEIDAGPGPVTDAGTDAGSPGDAGTDGGTSSDGGTPPPTGPTLIRLMAANITSGNGQSYDPGEGIRIFQGTHPDVVMIQEFNYGGNSPAAIRSFVDTAFGPSFSYYREGGAQIPNGVISRWPIIAAGEWTDTQVDNRDFAWARIDVPGPKDLWVVSVHLLTRSAGVRNTEAGNLVNFINTNVPTGDYLAIGGDFNTDSRSESCFSTFSSVVVTAGPYPADRNGNTNTNASRGSPYDHVLVDADLRQYQVGTVIGTSTFPAGLVADTRVYSPIWEIAPAQQSDSAATNMQHMGVIKDFLIPGGATTASITVTSPNGGESWVGGSTHSITWTSSGVTSVAVEYSLDGSNWMTLTPSTTASTGSYPWTVPDVDTSAARVRVSDASNSGLSDISNAAFTLTALGGSDGGVSDGGVVDGGPGPGPGDGGTGLVFINEVLINEPGGSVEYEFVELVNGGGSEVDLSGWTISDAVSVRHTFASGTVLGAGRAIVVFGGAAGIPSGLTNAVAASTGQLNLSNSSGDTVTVKNGAGTEAVTVDTATFTAALAVEPVSANRNPDGFNAGAFVLHTTLSPSQSQSSPGVRANGAPF